MKLALEASETRARLEQMSEYLRDELRTRGFDGGMSESQVVPVIVGSNEKALRVAAGLVDRGFGVKAIRPPTVAPGTARLRLSITANLNMADISDLLEALEDVR